MELWYHNPPDFAQLSDAQRDELLELRPPKKGRGNKEAHHKKGYRSGRNNSHGKNNPWEKKIKGQVAADIKRQKEADKEEKKKETEDLAELASLIYAVQPAAVSYNASNSNTATASVKINKILKRRQGIPWLGAGAPQQILSRAVGGLILEPNKHLFDKIMMSVSSVGKSDFIYQAHNWTLNSTWLWLENKHFSSSTVENIQMCKLLLKRWKF